LRYALIWMTMLGAPYAYGKDQHLSIRVLVDKFQSKNQIRTKIAVEIIVLILSIAVFIVGGIMVTANRTETSDAGLLCMYSNQWMSDGAVLFGAFEKMVHRIKGGKINGNSGSNLTCNCIFPDAGI
jgi:TRAP-type C4-dicarboxylate transport system permease small subunit